ncbi:50S ribosomal protein L25/general stress protein Ctc [Carboxylicivirga sp. N1Y90]|uniref:50S ribosomal protein L25/general stress protein Ctc n=1 Tax=Carboxylicivirga fragile TaxID=3417571 RepID=UPI003D32DD57|nr:50S ribosomal protein L25/general stress protein Ctc [Marinilabiliaceae bacterium N1Y90]
MQTIEINGTKRTDLGKKATKQLRNEANVPCVIYGGDEVIHLFAPAKEFNKIIFTPNVYILNVNVEGKILPCILQDTQFHPVSGDLIHVDFLQIKEDKAVNIEIPVEISGLAKGVREGGKLLLEKRKLKVRGLSKNLPDTLKIDISDLGLGDTIQVGGLSFDNIELTNAKNAVVVAVRLTRAARAAQDGGETSGASTEEASTEEASE